MDKWRSKMQGLVGKMDSLLTESHDTRSVEVDEEVMVKGAIEKARRELFAARSFFESVSDHDMVDHAVYSLQAAERKYAYLMKYARQKGYRQTLDQTLRDQIYNKEES